MFEVVKFYREMKSIYLFITLFIGSFLVGCGPTAEQKEKELKEISIRADE